MLVNIIKGTFSQDMKKSDQLTIGDRLFNIRQLEHQSCLFFEKFGTGTLLGRSVFENLNKQGHALDFDDILVGCGYGDDLQNFFKALLAQMFSQSGKPVTINKIKLPLLYLYHLLEIVLPGNALHRIGHVDQLEELGVLIHKEKRPDIAQVIDQYPVRLSDHVIRQAMVTDNVAKQYLPFAAELDTTGEPITFDGHLKHGVFEQMYENRVIFLLDMICPVFCRFCFRKHKTTRKEKTPSVSDVRRAVEKVIRRPAIREVLITGGEPMVNRPNLDAALEGLKKADHVDVIRIATRSIAYYPDLFLKNNQAYIHYLVEKNRELKECGKRIEMGIHFVHPDEVSIQSLDIITALVKNGVQVYVQTPFLNTLNTNGKDLAQLFSLLRNAGVKIYYIFAPCSPIHGTKPYWAPISSSIKALDELRNSVSDRSIPKLCTATPLGKIEWGTSGWAVEKDRENPEFVWIRTPYTRHYFQRFVKEDKKMPVCRQNIEKTLDARFRVDMGDDVLFAGNRPFKKKKPDFKTGQGHPPDKSRVLSDLLRTPHLKPSIMPVPDRAISRINPSVLEMNMAAGKKAMEYLEEHPVITDVILLLGAGDFDVPEAVINTINRIKEISQVTCLRISCPQINPYPTLFTKAWTTALAQAMDFSISTPFRVEVETWFLNPDEIGKPHEKLSAQLISRGINIYANVVLVKRVNDTPQKMIDLAYRLRRAAIEFHHLVVDGHTVHKKYNGQTVADESRLIEIASQLRRSCSGRQIPLYVIQTPLGLRPIDVTRSFEKV